MDPLASMRLVFIVITAISIAASFGLAGWRISMLRSRRRVIGEVTSVVVGARRKTASGTTSRSRDVRLRFRTLEGETVEASDSNAMGDHHESQQVPIWYDVVEPTDAIVGSFLRFWALPLFFLALGLVFAAVTIGV